MHLHAFRPVFPEFVKEELLYGISCFLQCRDISTNITLNSFWQISET